LLLIFLLSLLIFTCLCLWQGLLWGGANAPAMPMGLSWAQEAENVPVLVPIWRDVKILVRRVALLEGELAESCRAREVAEEKVFDLSSSSAEGS
jgi:hypothetical protein